MRYADVFGFYELNPFPGCNQVVVSNHACIYQQYRGQGRGDAQHRQRLSQAKLLGYDLILCTVRSDNDAELHLLKKYGWIVERGFKSKETGHDVQLWSRGLSIAV